MFTCRDTRTGGRAHCLLDIWSLLIKHQLVGSQAVRQRSNQQLQPADSKRIAIAACRHVYYICKNCVSLIHCSNCSFQSQICYAQRHASARSKPCPPMLQSYRAGVQYHDVPADHSERVAAHHCAAMQPCSTHRKNTCWQVAPLSIAHLSIPLIMISRNRAHHIPRVTCIAALLGCFNEGNAS